MLVQKSKQIGNEAQLLERLEECCLVGQGGVKESEPEVTWIGRRKTKLGGLKLQQSKVDLEGDVYWNGLKDGEVQCSLEEELCVWCKGTVLQPSRTNCGLRGDKSVQPRKD